MKQINQTTSIKAINWLQSPEKLGDYKDGERIA